MPRLHLVPKADSNADIVKQAYMIVFGDRDPVTQPGTATGSTGDWWPVFANSPGALEHALRGFGFYRDPARKLDPVLRELAQTWAGWAVGSQFVFSQHCKSLRGLGVSEEKIAGIAYWTVADCYNEQERAVLAYADCLSQAGGRVPIEVFDKLKTFWNDEQIFEFTYITCLYDMHAVITRALRMEYDAREDPIVEVAAPEGFRAADFLSAPRPAGS